MSQSPEMRLKLENAIKQSRMGGNKSDDANAKATTTASAAAAPGTIKLKTDFSNYTSWEQIRL